MRPVIALVSDFGTRDHYAGAMKGVMLGICPDAVLIDITHEVVPHDILEGALQLAAAFKYFPQKTIFVAIVDPGVGSARRGIAVDTGEYRFVAPDNGVLTLALREAPPKRIVELTERRYARPTVSRTFEGRDRFAPAAAWLAKGIEVNALGRTIPEFQSLTIPLPNEDGDTLRGEVLSVDRFGNVITNIDRRTFERFSARGAVTISTAGLAAARLVATYADIREEEICALFGSTDRLELAARSASAAARLALERGAPVIVGARPA